MTVRPSFMHCRGMLMAYYIVYNTYRNVGSAALARHTGGKMQDHVCHLNSVS